MDFAEYSITPAETTLPKGIMPTLDTQVTYTVRDGIILDENDPSRILPTHQLSGLPLTILPVEAPNTEARTWEDYDHGFFPRQSQELQDVGGAAVRCSRGQDMTRWLHNRKHTKFPNGPVLPRTAFDKYKVCVLACAEYIPRQAIDLRPSSGYEIVEMTDDQLEEFAHSKTIHIEDAYHPRPRNRGYHRHTLGKFFASFAIEQGLTDISSGVIDEFLNTPDQTRKRELGNLLLAKAVEATVEPVQRLHEELLDQGLTQLGRRDAHTTVRKFFVKTRFEDYYSTLEEKFKEAG